mmetsp:Transcript_23058/g.57001  ORF Transcript_23058/g.57001 Transcript_23058/m.57001 type:complete len:211 (-) Transcript_23058:275-907(-)
MNPACCIDAPAPRLDPISQVHPSLGVVRCRLRHAHFEPRHAPVDVDHTEAESRRLAGEQLQRLLDEHHRVPELNVSRAPAPHSHSPTGSELDGLSLAVGAVGEGSPELPVVIWRVVARCAAPIADSRRVCRGRCSPSSSRSRRGGGRNGRRHPMCGSVVFLVASSGRRRAAHQLVDGPPEAVVGNECGGWEGQAGHRGRHVTLVKPLSDV